MRERNKWLDVKASMGARRIAFGEHISYWFHHTPRRTLHAISYYKFAAKLVGGNKRVLDLGCGEGLGTWLLAKECGVAKGVDLDADAISHARKNWTGETVSFICEDFFNYTAEPFDALVSFDVIEHILSQNMAAFWSKVTSSLGPYGVALIGTPSEASQQHASEIARAGHVNVYDGARLEKEMRDHFHHVFMFAAHDEVVHTGYLPMAHYLIAVGCRPRKTD